MEQLKREAVEAMATAGKGASMVGYTGSAGTAILGFLGSSQFSIWVGVIIAVAGFVMNWHFKRQATRRYERESSERMLMRRIEHDERLRFLRGGTEPESGPVPLDDLGDLGGEG